MRTLSDELWEKEHSRLVVGGTRRIRASAAMGALIALACCASLCFAQSDPSVAPSQSEPLQGASSAPSSRPAAAVLTAGDLEAWLDGFLPYALQREDIAGAVIVVVKGGQVLLQKGYGYADVAARRPVDPETTLFRPGSISKLFTWTAVMQLAEQHKLDLDVDVNNYLDFKIPAYRGQPITLRDLMTHTPGFEDTLRDVYSAPFKDVTPLDQFVKERLPERIFPPGQATAYSNYGVTLAGYIVQRVSGQLFDEYIEQHLLGQLGMDRSTFRQPLPAPLRPLMANGYNVGSGAPQPFEMIGVAPAGSASVTGADMAKFMIAHLQDGKRDGQQILRPETAKEMHDTAQTLISPSLHRFVLGFYEMDRNGHRIIAHDGDSRWFHSNLLLYLDDDVGMFFSMNSRGRAGGAFVLRQGLYEAFTDRYFPGSAMVGRVDPQTAKAHAAQLAGVYRESRRGDATFFSLRNLWQQVQVRADEAGHIVASNILGLNEQPKRFEEIAPYQWQEIGGKHRLAAKVVDGAVAMWADDEHFSSVLVPTPFTQDARWLRPLMYISMLVLLVSVLRWPLSAWGRRHHLAGSVFTAPHVRGATFTSIVTFSAGLLIWAWLTTVKTMSRNGAFSSEVVPWIVCLHLASSIVIPLAVLLALRNTWMTLKTQRGTGALFAMGWSLVVAIAAVSLLAIALNFHLIGLSSNF